MEMEGPMLKRGLETKTKQMRNLEMIREMERKFWRTNRAFEATRNAEQNDYTMVMRKHGRCARRLWQDE